MSERLLTDLQEEVLGILFNDSWFRRYFYLTGGTALSAFHLYHRYSDDLDFFGHGVELAHVENLMRANFEKGSGHQAQQVQKAPQFLRYSIDETLKIDFVADVPFRVGVPELASNFMVDNIKNIAVNKVCTILSRFDPKDYVDFYFIQQSMKFEVPELLSLAQKKDAGLEVFTWASLLGSVDDIAILPRMVKAVTKSELQDFYHKLRDELLDMIKPGTKKRPHTEGA